MPTHSRASTAPQERPDQVHRRVGHGRFGRHPGGLRQVRSLLQDATTDFTTRPWPACRARLPCAGARRAAQELRADAVDAETGGKGEGQELKQVWFAGVHSDVGGGYPEHGSSDIPLAWMASEVVALSRHRFRLPEDRGATCRANGPSASCTSRSKGSGSSSAKNAERRLPRIRTSFEKIHASVAARIKGGGSGGGRRLRTVRCSRTAILPRHSVDLSDAGSGLRWKDDEVKPGDAPAKKAVSFRDKLIKAIGGG